MSPLTLKSKIFGVAAAAVMFATGASATTISISTFDIANFGAATSTPSFVIQDFEAIGAGMGAGELAGPLATNVGTFAAMGGVGNGGTCQSNSVGGNCTQVALEQGDNSFDQGNHVPDNGEWSLNSNDTMGIQWDAFKGGAAFNRVVFAIKDGGDRPGITLTVSADGASEQIGPNATSGGGKLIVIDFSSKVTMASIFMANNQLLPPDSFSIDGASVGLVPLPATALMLLGGIGAFGAMRRRQK